MRLALASALLAFAALAALAVPPAAAESVCTPTGADKACTSLEAQAAPHAKACAIVWTSQGWGSECAELVYNGTGGLVCVVLTSGTSQHQSFCFI